MHPCMHALLGRPNHGPRAHERARPRRASIPHGERPYRRACIPHAWPGRRPLLPCVPITQGPTDAPAPACSSHAPTPGTALGQGHSLAGHSTPFRLLVPVGPPLLSLAGGALLTACHGSAPACRKAAAVRYGSPRRQPRLALVLVLVLVPLRRSAAGGLGPREGPGHVTSAGRAKGTCHAMRQMVKGRKTSCSHVTRHVTRHVMSHVTRHVTCCCFLKALRTSFRSLVARCRSDMACTPPCPCATWPAHPWPTHGLHDMACNRPLEGRLLQSPYALACCNRPCPCATWPYRPGSVRRRCRCCAAPLDWSLRHRALWP